MTNKSPQNIFIQGAIPAGLIMEVMQQHSQNADTGAYSIFMGQVRSDEMNGSRVSAVEFTTHTQIALSKFAEILSYLLEKYPVTHLMAYHSVGKVRVGEICFFVLAASPHRREAINACNEAVERIKSELAIWGKLLLENDSSIWKENS